MRFVKYVSPDGTKPQVRLDLEGLPVPANVARLSSDVLEKCFLFHIDTYETLTGKKNKNTTAYNQKVLLEKNWLKVFGTVHTFLDTLPQEEVADIADFMLTCNADIRFTFSNDDIDTVTKEVIQMENRLADRLATLDQKWDLANQILVYTRENIRIKLSQNIGERPQDSKEMTFQYEEIVELTAIAILCKMLTPLFGNYIFFYSRRFEGNTDSKESHAVTILRDVIHRNFEVVMDKLYNYITKILKNVEKHVSQSYTAVHAGWSFQLIVQAVYNNALVKKFVAANFVDKNLESSDDDSNSNLMIYISTCVRQSATSHYRSPDQKTTVTKISSPDDRANVSDDDGNVSILELESKTSTRTADYPILVKAAALEAIDRFITIHELELDEIEQASNFYEFNHVALTPVNEYLLGIVFGGYLCGAKSIECLDGAILAKLIPLMQAFFIQQGYYSLVELVSLNICKGEKTPNNADNRLRVLWNSNQVYQNCDHKFTYCVGDLRWDTGLKSIIDSLSSTIYAHNTAPVFLNKLGLPNRNGSVYYSEENIPVDVCTLIDQLYS